jgi:hypothetical protein
MFIVWNRLGFLVIPIVIIGVVLGSAIAGDLPNEKWPLRLAVVLTAAATFGLGVLLGRPKVLGRDSWGNAIHGTEDHSLYWIPVKYWGAIILVAGTIIVFKP